MGYPFAQIFIRPGRPKHCDFRSRELVDQWVKDVALEREQSLLSVRLELDLLFPGNEVVRIKILPLKEIVRVNILSWKRDWGETRETQGKQKQLLLGIANNE